MTRQELIAKSIIYAVLFGSGDLLTTPTGLLTRIFNAFTALFTIYQLNLVRIRDDLFSQLRKYTWNLSENGYASSFEGKPSEVLKATGDMGYSGSTFFTTADGKYLVKSVPRRFEHSYFRDDLLIPYIEHMKEHPESLLIRITDFLAAKGASIGRALGLAPSHHIVMTNLLTGKKEAEDTSDASGGKTGKWETYDLKPTSYFFPERDIAGGRLTSEATKERLADKFEDKIVLKRQEVDDLLTQLEADTRVLEEANAVDYSLFLVRIPLKADGQQRGSAGPSSSEPPPPEEPPFTPPDPPSWHTGVKSADGKYVYRMAVLDFFWAKHKVHARFMTLLISAWNLIDRQGPMSITTTSDEYRERFLKMVEEMLEVSEDDTTS